MLHTPNYQLPKYEPNDITSYLTTYNDTMDLIDTGMHTNATDIIRNTTNISSLEQQMSTANDEINELTGEVSDLTTTVQGHGGRLDGIDQTITNLQQKDANLEREIADIGEVAGQVYRGVLSANEVTIAITIGEFNSNTLVDVYTGTYGRYPTNVALRAASGGQPNVCVLTFESAAADMNVAVVTHG